MKVQLAAKISIIVFLIMSNSYCLANNEENASKKDTVAALVISPNNPLYEDITKLSGNQIVGLIDSILDLDEIPHELLKEISSYAESRLLEHDYYVSLTNYYENEGIPSNDLYGKWDTKHIAPYDESIRKEDTSITLRLVDPLVHRNFVAPIQGPVITSNFGWRYGRNHNGIDLDLEVWDPVVASFDGKVRIALYHHPGYGRVVVIRHYNGLETLYAHLHRLKVKAGDIVEAGQVIGLGGSSGRSSGSHLHYEVRFKGKPLNPRHLISFKENKLISNTLRLIKQKWSYTCLPMGVEYHTIEPGDFMYKIANRYGLTIDELCDMNGVHRNKRLIAGKKLRIK